MVLNAGNLRSSAGRNERSLHSIVKDRTLKKLDIQGVWTVMSKKRRKFPFRTEMT